MGVVDAFVYDLGSCLVDLDFCAEICCFLIVFCQIC